ncbi:MAG: hypothetical protein QGG71_22915, partial [Pirellulaceae bacterium]|nr:hypothetical protein [Pirellulaceae bacterium]
MISAYRTRLRRHWHHASSPKTPAPTGRSKHEQAFHSPLQKETHVSQVDQKLPYKVKDLGLAGLG